MIYLKKQQDRKILVADYQQKISGYNAPQPDSNAYTIAEEQWLAQRQAELSRNAALNSVISSLAVIMQNMSQLPPSDRLRILTAVTSGSLLADLYGDGVSRLSSHPITQQTMVDEDRGIQGFSSTVRVAESQNLTPVRSWQRFFISSHTGRRLGLLNERLANNPDSTAARLERAQILSRHGEQALVDYNYILERFPDNITALLGRASLYERLVQEKGISGEQAWHDYHRVLAIDPQNQAAHEGIDRLPSSSLGLD